MNEHKELILGSSSQSRLDILQTMGFNPKILVADIDESAHSNETARNLALRLACAKAEALIKRHNITNAVLLTGDTVVSIGRRIIDKALTEDDVVKAMKMLSGRNHTIYSAFSITNLDKMGHIIYNVKKVKYTKITFRRLTQRDIEMMIESKSGIGKAGGYTVESFAESFMTKISGQVSTIRGLPTYPVTTILMAQKVQAIIK